MLRVVSLLNSGADVETVGGGVCYSPTMQCVNVHYITECFVILNTLLKCRRLSIRVSVSQALM